MEFPTDEQDETADAFSLELEDVVAKYMFMELSGPLAAVVMLQSFGGMLAAIQHISKQKGQDDNVMSTFCKHVYLYTIEEAYNRSYDYIKGIGLD